MLQLDYELQKERNLSQLQIIFIERNLAVELRFKTIIYQETEWK